MSYGAAAIIVFIVLSCTEYGKQATRCDVTQGVVILRWKGVFVRVCVSLYKVKCHVKDSRCRPVPLCRVVRKEAWCATVPPCVSLLVLSFLILFLPYLHLGVAQSRVVNSHVY